MVYEMTYPGIKSDFLNYFEKFLNEANTTGNDTIFSINDIYVCVQKECLQFSSVPINLIFEKLDYFSNITLHFYSFRK
jgi:poly(A) polymerase Pap1